MLFTTYLAGYIEASPKTATNWRDEVYEELYVPNKTVVYDPMRMEALKTGQKAGEHVQYVVNLKRAGKYEQFDKEMDKIWLGNIQPTMDLMRLFELLKDRANVDGNREEEARVWGDYEAVARSNFIIALMKHDVQTVGTIGEIFEAMLLKIPVYLVIDTPKTKTNSTLLYWVRKSGGEIFYTVKECTEYIKDKYKI